MDDIKEKLGKAFDGTHAARGILPSTDVTAIEALALLLECADKDTKSGIDHKELATNLIQNFGSLGGVLHAGTQKLCEEGLDMNTITMLHSVLAAQLHLLKAEINKSDTIIKSMEELAEYVTASYAYDKTERFSVFFIDNNNLLISDEIMGVGTINHVSVYPREVVKRALELEASGIILVHNHPSGIPQPSKADVELTKQIVTACQAVDISVFDHIIVGHEGAISSLRMMQLI